MIRAILRRLAAERLRAKWQLSHLVESDISNCVGV